MKIKYDPSGHAKCKHREVIETPFSRDFCKRRKKYCDYGKCEKHKGWKKPVYDNPDK